MSLRTFMLLFALLLLAGPGCAEKEPPPTPPGDAPGTGAADVGGAGIALPPPPTPASLRADFDAMRTKYDALFEKLDSRGLDVTDLRRDGKAMEREIDKILASFEAEGEPEAGTPALPELERAVARYRELDERAWNRLRDHVDREIRDKGLEPVMTDILSKKKK